MPGGRSGRLDQRPSASRSAMSRIELARSNLVASRLDPKNVEKVRDECNKRDVIPTAILATSLPVAVKVIGFMTPSGSETLRQPLASESSWG